MKVSQIDLPLFFAKENIYILNFCKERITLGEEILLRSEESKKIQGNIVSTSKK